MLRDFNLTIPKSVTSALTSILMVVVLALNLSLSNVSPAMAASSINPANPNNQASQQIEIDAAPDVVFDAAQQAFETWKRGEFVKADASARVVTGLSRTNVFKFVDDVDVAISPSAGDPSKTVLSIQSVGRMGEFDFGGNQRNIDEYMDALRALL